MAAAASRSATWGQRVYEIPRIIHQTWKDERIPVPLQKLAETWKQNHPGWEYRLWTDKENRDFLNTFYPAFLARFDFASVQPCARVALTKSWRRSRDCAFGGSLASRLLLCWW